MDSLAIVFQVLVNIRALQMKNLVNYIGMV